MSGHCNYCGETGGHAEGCYTIARPTPPASQESAGKAVALDTGNLSDDTLYWALDRLYERGWLDKHKENDYDPRGTQEWQHTLDLFRAFRAALTAELSEAREQRDRLAQENLERAEAVIAQAANARNLADALKKLNNAARISGGVAGPDKNLMDACENAERALSLVGVGRAVNAVLDVMEQRDSLRDECERLREQLIAAVNNPDDPAYWLHSATAALSAGEKT